MIKLCTGIFAQLTFIVVHSCPTVNVFSLINKLQGYLMLSVLFIFVENFSCQRMEENEVGIYHMQIDQTLGHK